MPASETIYENGVRDSFMFSLPYHIGAKLGEGGFAACHSVKICSHDK